jgi:Predicted membrane protein (DUF2306)
VPNFFHLWPCTFCPINFFTMSKRILWLLFATSSILIGSYPAIYFIINRKFGLLSTKTEALLTDWVWNTAFYTHIVLGGLALLIGWAQFSPGLRTRYPAWHRGIGKTYVGAVLLSGAAGLHLAWHASAGPVAALGFACLDIVWLGSTWAGYRSAHARQFAQHQRWMTYSYAASFGAVMLRIWLPLLMATFQDFNVAYRIVAWLAWVPNILVALWLVRLQENRAKVGLAGTN